jgi:hypothetical protein
MTAHDWPAWALLSLLATSCATVPPPPPVFPEQFDDSSFFLAFGQTYMPAKVVVTSPTTGPVTIHENSEGNYPTGWPGLFDPRVGIAELPYEHLAWAVHLSWLTNGLAVHYLPLGLATGWPVALTLGCQTDGPIGAGMAGTPGFAWELRGGASLSPRLSPRAQVMLGAGASYGPRRFRLVAPAAIARNQADNFFAGDVRILRTELRAEGLLGIVFPLSQHSRVMLSLEPFYVGHAGATESGCTFCVDGLTLSSFAADWGFAFQLGWLR